MGRDEFVHDIAVLLIGFLEHVHLFLLCPIDDTLPDLSEVTLELSIHLLLVLVAHLLVLFLYLCYFSLALFDDSVDLRLKAF